MVCQHPRVPTFFVRPGSPTTVVAAVQRSGGRDVGVVASNDGVEWRAAWHLDFYRQAEVAGLITFTSPTRYKLQPGVMVFAREAYVHEEYRNLLEWARKVATPQSPNVITASRSMHPDAIRDVPCPLIGRFRLTGWQRVEKASAHTANALAQIVGDAVAVCAKAWGGWKPDGLTVSFHSSRKAMGLAYAPGNGDRRISLNERLLTSYDAISIARVVLHELCHHAREEQQPRERFKGYNSHDPLFCSMLVLVDAELAANPKRCRFFVDEQDDGVVAASSAAKGIVYAAGVGLLRIGVSPNRKMRMRWEPIGTSKWRPSWEPFTSVNFLSMLRRFVPDDRYDVTIAPEFSDRFYRAFPPTDMKAPEFVEYMYALSDPAYKRLAVAAVEVFE